MRQFRCGRFGHLREACPQVLMGKETEGMRLAEISKNANVGHKEKLDVQERVKKEEFGDWMVDEC